ncbi:MAG: hypothetical protein LBC98_02870 [Prevotellaceae bacterium]|jgi:hypothetical protein|nr:hypothetical protein [Prevotellaceae bacterium]
MERTYVYDILKGVNHDELEFDDVTIESVIARATRNLEMYRRERDLLLNRGRISKKGLAKLQPYIDALIPDAEYLEKVVTYSKEARKEKKVIEKVEEDPLAKTLQGIQHIIDTSDKIFGRIKSNNRTIKPL